MEELQVLIDKKLAPDRIDQFHGTCCEEDDSYDEGESPSESSWQWFHINLSTKASIFMKIVSGASMSP